jgi:hypothetical protein
MYKSFEFRADDLYVDVASLASASEAASPFRAACAICSFHERDGSSYTPRTRIALFWRAIEWPLIRMIDVRSSRACRPRFYYTICPII